MRQLIQGSVRETCRVGIGLGLACARFEDGWFGRDRGPERRCVKTQTVCEVDSIGGEKKHVFRLDVELEY